MIVFKSCNTNYFICLIFKQDRKKLLETRLHITGRELRSKYVPVSPVPPLSPGPQPLYIGCVIRVAGRSRGRGALLSSL